MRISHKVDYGVRAMVALGRQETGVPIKREDLAEQESIPAKFLDDILRALRNHELVRSHRGPEGGWTLARRAEDISVADVIRVLEGPLASVRGFRPHELADEGVPAPLVSLWVAVRASLRNVLEHVTIADLVTGELPVEVTALLADDDAWASR